MYFERLKFKNRNDGIEGTQAIIEFDNGYGASVITGKMFYTSKYKPYELAVLKGDSLCYDTEITDDVIGHLNKRDVEKILQKIQKLKAV